MQTEFYFLRHGQCEQEGIMRGQVDANLTPLGLTQMQQSFTGLNIKADAIWCSPLSRCLGFAQTTADTLGVDLIQSPELMEMHFGDWDGCNIDALYQSAPEALDRFWRSPWSQTPPNGEAMVDFEARVAQVWQQMLSQCAGQERLDSQPESEPRKILVVTHAGVMRQMLASILSRGEHQFFTHLALPYAKVIKLSVYTDEQGEHFPQVHL